LPVFNTKNPEVSKIIVIFENAHDKNWTKCQKLDSFECGNVHFAIFGGQKF